jgi:hypothetical protein
VLGKRLSRPLAWAAIAISTLPATTFAQAEQRSVYVSALDQSGAPVKALAPTDLVVREDKVTREILSIGPAAEPMQIALIVDNSQAAEPFIRDYRAALVEFINAIGADDTGAAHQVSLITVAERPTIVAEYTAEMRQVVNGAQRMFAVPGSGSYLLDGIIEVSQGFKKRNASRPVIVAVITEGPELSDRHYQSVLEPLRESGAAFHVVIVGTPRNNDEDRSVVLGEGTSETGGRYDTVLTSSALPGRMKQVAAELTHQFRVVYARPRTLIPPERVTVTSAKQGLTIRGTPMKQDREQEHR